MASKKESEPKKDPFFSGPCPTPPPTEPANNGEAPPAPKSEPEAAGEQSQAPPGLDPARHAAAQKRAYQAEVMRKALFPSLMADALNLDGTFESAAYKLYLDRLLEDAGSPTDPIECMMLEQLALAHFRVGQLQGQAGKSKGIEAAKIYSAAASRLLGEFRRTALALHVYRRQAPKDKPASKLKLYKAAQ